MDEQVKHLQDARGGTLILERDGARVAEMTYRRQGASRILIDHSYVEPALRGRGLARRLLDAAVEWARSQGVRIDATCSYVIAEFARDASLKDVRG